ncbi:hypothetical protein CAOG_02099 [Capsaspora owczarzaki ATCC 30864]|uniref:Levanase n=1 Tax=Capsaspora owczarzaki (strain ATCC 30864) TaxID=595528 RepID=A0A0D2X1I3_CAPO3|nr:hypothetical protein CAOG_02099 [Capsaspora owczarzaki ATCC 30864]KJE90859.1 hypothetical protein CAOG_002099 [Capsaspora owczarzaki ATCC 30864]|eukprot:XP_004348849.1 hypothetical protein CAOG_02099 [Capsaspora owczarzaki ATCC 30864]
MRNRSVAVSALATVLVLACASAVQAEYVEQRPGYHFTPPEDWMNDPNGPMYLNGLYHLFYQSNPFDPWWATMHWGHAVSTDLFHWQHLPIALSPDQTYDANGVFSGSATIIEDGMPVLMYTAVDDSNFETQAVAYPANISDPFLTNWTKPYFNPIVPDGILPDFVDPYNVRDDTTAWNGNGGAWFALIGAKLDYPNTTNVNVSYGGALLVTSAAYGGLSKWEYVKVFHTNTYGGDMWECPDFYPVNRSDPNSLWVMKASANGGDTWATFHYSPASQKLTLASNDIAYDEYQAYDLGWSFYASKSFYDPLIQSQVVFGWLREEDNDATTRGWASAQTVPRVVSLDTDGVSILQNPHPNILSLRSNNVTYTNLPVSSNMPYRLPLIADQADIEFSVSLPYPLPSSEIERVMTPEMVLKRYNMTVSNDSIIYGVNVRVSNGGEESTPLYFAIDPSALSADAIAKAAPASPFIAQFGFTRTSSSQTNQGSTTPINGHVKVDRPTGSQGSITFSMRALVDHSVVEVFVQGGRVRATGRIYPVRADSMFIEVFSEQTIASQSINIKAYQLLDSMPAPPIP